ncbi:1 TM domain-containing transmembrane protein [Acrasis kona]|uniref:Transmembrane protein 231 n=1 Tax=Acrasis kona TaxID=1008807 RepID=A0AAW2Z0S0_9EUKA
MEAIAHISYSSATPGSSLTVMGSLMLSQDGPLSYYFSQNTYNNTAIDFTTVDSLDQISIEDILRFHSQDSISAYFQPKNNIWRDGYDNLFTLNVEITIPQQVIHYQPGFPEVIKFAWIQYLSAAVVVYFVTFQTYRFIVMMGLLPTRITFSKKI